MRLQREDRRRRRRLLPPVLALTCLGLGLCAACSGGGGDGNPVPGSIAANFAPSDTAPAADQVRLLGRAAGDVVSVDVVIAGPTDSPDLYSFAFDLLVQDPTVVEYVDGSAAFGTALVLEAGQQGEVLAASDGTRITVGATKLGGGPGNGVGDAEPAVATLRFRVLRRGNTSLRIASDPAPAALDSAGDVIGTVRFDLEAAALWGS